MSKQLSFDFDVDDYQGPDDLWLLYLWEKAMAKDDEEFENRFKLKPIEKDKSQHQNRYFDKNASVYLNILGFNLKKLQSQPKSNLISWFG